VRQISLTKLVLNNFRSFSRETISFPQTIGLKLLTGKNTVSPKLGANAAGKSSLWDALCWLLYGSGVQGIKTSSIVSWGETQTEVVAEFMIANVLNSIRRTGPPSKIELNGKPATQEQIDELMGLSKFRFLNAVLFGQEVSFFPDLPVPERGLLLDEVLDLNIWQLATETASKKYIALENELKDKKVNISFLEGKLSSLPSDNQIIKQSSEWETEQKKKIDNLQRLSLDWENKQELLIANLKEQESKWKQDLLNTAEEKAKAIEDLDAESAPLVFETQYEIESPFVAQISILEQHLKTIEKTRDRQTEILHQAEHELKSCITAEGFWTTDVCPTCLQPITEDKKRHEILCVAQLKEAVEAKKNKANEATKKANADIISIQQQLKDLRSQSIRDEEKKKSAQRELTRIQNQIKNLTIETRRLVDQMEGTNPYSTQLSELEPNPFITQVDNLIAEKNPFANKLTDLRKERSKLINEYASIEQDYKQTERLMIATEYWKHGFKRIRLYFVHQVLAALQVEIGSALSALGLEGWSVGLDTEKLTKSETVRLGVQLIIKSPRSEAPWETFSGGEKQRLRLAITLGLASLIQRAAGVFYTFEVWDEPTRSLSGEGVEDLLESLRYRAESVKKQIWLVDHSTFTYGSFDEVWEVSKTGEGSKVYKTYGKED
jgi:DNA repair protein SbcC/Rad50